MKRILGITQTILFVSSVLFLSASCTKNNSKQADAAQGGGAINLFTWQDYVPDVAVNGFEKETGIKVNYSYFSTNEEALAKLQASKGQYDLVLCSDYIIDLMLSTTDILDTLDKSKINNWGNLDTRLLGKYYDPENKYSMPYWISSSAILWDPARTNIDFKHFSVYKLQKDCNEYIIPAVTRIPFCLYILLSIFRSHPRCLQDKPSTH